MTIHHIVTMSLNRVPLANECTLIVAACNSLKDNISVIKSMKCGFNLGISGEMNGSFAISAEFSCIEDYESYASHPVHVEFVSKHMKPLLAENGRHAVQFETM